MVLDGLKREQERLTGQLRQFESDLSEKKAQLSDLNVEKARISDEKTRSKPRIYHETALGWDGDALIVNLEKEIGLLQTWISDLRLREIPEIERRIKAESPQEV